MEILLLEDIKGVGKKNDLLVVGDGFALNYLLPQRKALVATPTVRKRYAEQIKRRAEEKEQERKVKSDLGAAIAGKSLTFTKKATKNGKLYAAISEALIAEAMKEQLKLDIPEDSIEIPDPIKAVGQFQVKIRIGEMAQTVSITVKTE